MKKQKSILIILLFIVTISSIFSIKKSNHSQKDMHYISVEVNKNDGGYGYQIMIDHKCYIDQPYIPAIKGRKPFSSYNDALKTGTFVANKIGIRKSPTISIKDLRDLQITL
ncbi:DUF4907 domain-containing protein [Halosquirtibacter laminarini]|uniref:DUF4907 domain-containing protein n=1 Tax=Halosquirtibacter laminarini TaxID=3374600 RepID=A0AC61NNC8_9BACT|nr:DUF4907 domain-containing protein [Prolixibacteraceae bacterium]